MVGPIPTSKPARPDKLFGDVSDGGKQRAPEQKRQFCLAEAFLRHLERRVSSVRLPGSPAEMRAPLTRSRSAGPPSPRTRGEGPRKSRCPEGADEGRQDEVARAIAI